MTQVQITKVMELLTVNVKKGVNVEELTNSLNEILNTKQPKVMNEALVIDGVTYKFCSFSKMYYKADDFVKGKNYTKAAYKIWHHYYAESKRMVNAASKKLYAGEIELQEFNRLVEESKEFDNRKSDLASYDDVRQHGFTKEQLLDT